MKYIIGVLLALVFFAALGGGWVFLSGFYPWALQGTLKGHRGVVTSVAFSPDGKTLATAGVDRTARLWDLATRQERAILQGHTADVFAVAFSPDGKSLATASQDGTVRLWDVATGHQSAVLAGHARPDREGRPLAACAVAFSPEGRLLASGGADGTVRLWEVATGKEVAVLKHDTDVRSLAITPDGKLLAARTIDGIITVWDLVERKELRRFEEWHVSSPIFSVILAPDGKTLASNGTASLASDDTVEHEVKLWDVTTGQQLATLKLDLGWDVASMAFSPDGKVLAGKTLFGGKMVFWDVATGQLLGIVHFPYRTYTIAFSPDGSTLASTHDDGAVKLWDTAKLIPPK